MLRRFLLGLAGLAAGGLLAVSVIAGRHVPTLPPRVWIGPVEVEGLTADEAARKLRTWWDQERRRQLAFVGKGLSKAPGPRSLTNAGVVLNDSASVAQVPEDRFWEAAKRVLLLREPELRRFPVVFETNPDRLADLAAEVAQNNRATRPARVTYSQGAFTYQTEQAGLEIDAGETAVRLLNLAMSGASRLELPVVEASKRVPDEALRTIREVVSSYTTRFSAGQVSRSSNIRLAANKIDGEVLMPGERFSFNGHVGPRTVSAGYRMAGVYVNGRHDTGIGGGICQVSTTLYNAALLADLRIVRRHNHSLPVPYVPSGRDAAVSYGALDLEFENNTAGPIAISSLVERGRVTFRILGRTLPGKEVRIVSGPVQRWSRGERVVHDATLPPGKSRVVEKGAIGKRVTTYRIVLQDGREVRRDPLGTSKYAGAVRIVARNLIVTAPPASAPPTEPPPVP